jgi:hypothetical protein
MSEAINGAINGTTSYYNSKLNEALAAASAGDPGSILKAQVAFSQAQFALTATSEIIKGEAEAKKGIAKNMSA